MDTRQCIRSYEEQGSEWEWLSEGPVKINYNYIDKNWSSFPPRKAIRLWVTLSLLLNGIMGIEALLQLALHMSGFKGSSATRMLGIGRKSNSIWCPATSRLRSGQFSHLMTSSETTRLLLCGLLRTRKKRKCLRGLRTASCKSWLGALMSPKSSSEQCSKVEWQCALVAAGTRKKDAAGEWALLLLIDTLMSCAASCPNADSVKNLSLSSS